MWCTSLEFLRCVIKVATFQVNVLTPSSGWLTMVRADAKRLMHYVIHLPPNTVVWTGACMFSSVLRALGDLILSAGIMELTHTVDKTMLPMLIILNFRLLELILQLLVFGVSYAQVLIGILSKWSLLRIDLFCTVECIERVLSSGQLTVHAWSSSAACGSLSRKFLSHL